MNEHEPQEQLAFKILQALRSKVGGNRFAAIASELLQETGKRGLTSEGNMKERIRDALLVFGVTMERKMLAMWEDKIR